MKKLTLLALCAACVSMMAFSNDAMATEKTRAALQTDLDNHKYISFEPEVMYEDMVNMTDSHVNKTTDILPVSLDGAESLTNAIHGGGILLTSGDANGDGVYIFPEATGTGASFYAVVDKIPNVSQVFEVATDDVMEGGVNNIDTNDGSDTFFLTAATSDTVTLTSTTSGAQSLGGWLLFEDKATDTWNVSGVIFSSGAEVTPFSAAVP